MAQQPQTILDLKLSFLRTQISQLSRPLTLPPSFEQNQPSHLSDRDILRQKQIDEALAQLNIQIRKHSKLAYSGVAQRHVAEQIDALYWKAGERDVRDGTLGVGRDGDDDDVLERGADYAQSSTIAALPADWDDNDNAPAEASANYSAVVERLQKLDERRSELRKKVQVYKQLKEALVPFENPTVDVQPNLCTRNGELEQEMERMRTLLARVAGRLVGLETGSVGVAKDGDLEMIDQGEKIKALLAMK